MLYSILEGQASSPRLPITVCSRNEVERPAHTSHTRRTNEGAKRDPSEPFLGSILLWPQNVERVSLSFPTSNFSATAILRLKFEVCMSFMIDFMIMDLEGQADVKRERN